jgi:hypothetical protein
MTVEIENKIVEITKLEMRNLELSKEIKIAYDEKKKAEKEETLLMNEQERLKLDITNAWDKLKNLLIRI